MQAKDRLVVALDVPGRQEALSLARRLAGEVGMVKVGLEGFTAHGPDLVQALVDLGLSIFLDLKVHDIPRTAEAALREASRLGARLVTVHALGGPEMLKAAAAAAHGGTEVIAVTLLTSMDQETVKAIGLCAGVSEAASRLGEMALASGVHGLVCSAHELEPLSRFGGSRMVPGIRPAGAAVGDQRRVATPKSAVASGATWIVVGRPIVQAPDPVAAARAIVAEMGGGPAS